MKNQSTTKINRKSITGYDLDSNKRFYIKFIDENGNTMRAYGFTENQLRKLDRKEGTYFIISDVNIINDEG